MLHLKTIVILVLVSYIGFIEYQKEAYTSSSGDTVRGSSSSTITPTTPRYLTCRDYAAMLGNKRIPDNYRGTANMACGNHPYYDKLATIGWSGFQWETAASQWESRTQKIFAHLITEETTYLGFGE
jgi:hypothetical protein